MKKFYLSIAFLAFCGINANAQLSIGGFPQSMKAVMQHENYIPTQNYPLPDWNAFVAENEKDAASRFSKPYQIGLPVTTDITFPSGGTFVTLENGVKIWSAQIQIQGAPAIGLYYDKFQLPDDVQLYLSNDTKNQVLGAYNSSNNTEDGVFANEAILGDVINIELNIGAAVNINDIQLHINKALVYFRSYEYLNKYRISKNTGEKPTDVDPFGLEGSSSTCEINAICPLGQNYPKQRKSIVQIIHPQGYFCSATLVNNTANSATSCKNYLLTATHCDPNNDTSGFVFSQLLVRMNFEKEQCTGGADATVNTLTGVRFRARANYTNTQQPEINGDFMLVELRNAIPVTWDIYQAGWNRGTTMPTLTYPKRYIGFHHPAGDVKKVSVSHTVSPNGEAGGSLGAGTHWQISSIDSGGVEGGSSGSGLFDGDGRLIGIASVAGNPDANCNLNGQGGEAAFLNFVDYGKFSLAWDYNVDGNFNSRMLKPWLDPTNSGVVTLDAVKSNCTDAVTPPPPTGITNNGFMLDNNINVYPNPSVTGIITAGVNFAEATDLEVDIYNIAGAKQASYHLKKVVNDHYNFDLSHFSNGVYLMKFSDGNNTASKKIMIAK
jgi:hypothetical protein